MARSAVARWTLALLALAIDLAGALFLDHMQPGWGRLAVMLGVIAAGGYLFWEATHGNRLPP